MIFGLASAHSGDLRGGQPLLQRIRTSVQTAGSIALEGVALLVSASGSAAALVLGKALLAIALRAFAFAAFLRLSSRRRQSAPPERQGPVWLAPMIGLITMIECAVLVEATDLPVRFTQPGFQVHHWLFVLAFVIVAYVGQSRLIRRAYD